MRHFLPKLFLLLLPALLPVVAKATHLYGADLYYTYISGTSYRVTLTLYGDCSGSSFPSLSGATPQIRLINGSNNSVNQTITLSQSGPGVEVTPICPGELTSSVCNNPAGTLPGVTRYIYTGTLTVPSANANWIIRFTGNTGNGSQAGRSNNITNLNGGSSIMVLDATLNNTVGNNSSPQFTTIPTPFYCVNTPQQYNQGAVDPNGDSLGYALVDGITSANGNNVTAVDYAIGYSGAAPLSATGFTFDAVTGQLAFTPNLLQRSLVVNKVNEYRNGVLVGSAMREMTFVVLTCNNIPPAGNVNSSTPNTNIQNGAFDGNNVINVCTGGNVHFQIHPTDGDGDSLFVTLNGVPAGASATIAGNNTVSPTITFDWNTAGVLPGSYTFFATYKDYACPLSSFQTQAYTVRIVKPYTESHSQVAVTECLHPAVVRYTLGDGLAPRTLTIRQDGVVVKTLTDNGGGTLQDSLPVGTYTITVSSPVMPCSTLASITIVDGGVYPHTPVADSDRFYCQNAVALPLNALVDSGAVPLWYGVNNQLLGGTPVPSTAQVGQTVYYVSQRYKVCESLRDSVTVTVTKPPVSLFSLPSDTLCSADTVTVAFTGQVGAGNVRFDWNWAGADYVHADTAAKIWRVRWASPGLKKLSLTVIENGCSSTRYDYTIFVKPSPVVDFNTGNLCLYDSLYLRLTVLPATGLQYAWNFDGANISTSEGPGPFELQWSSAGTKQLSLLAMLSGCTATVRKEAEVYPTPAVHITGQAAPVCLGDKIALNATGGLRYEWQPEAAIRQQADGSLYAQVVSPTTFTVKAFNEWSCFGSDSIRYDQIQPCCNFSYPDAFSPNADGRNDRFHIVTYGNQTSFELLIFNRWGQRVYIGFDPQQGWDGTIHGVPAEAGVYFYRLKAKCMTGHLEEKAGEVMLVR